jgi:hypothetical protein
MFSLDRAASFGGLRLFRTVGDAAVEARIRGGEAEMCAQITLGQQDFNLQLNIANAFPEHDFDLNTISRCTITCCNRQN